MSLYKMEYINGIYHWSQSSVTCHVMPMTVAVSLGAYYCSKLWKYTPHGKDYLDTIATDTEICTPSFIEYDEEEGTAAIDEGRSSKITPTARANKF
ncbi:hypothetical protein FBU30_003602 [Linnemannia zychae]|nr:hypothetical protein FBU30_003602 [Linnemannia zychae]